jgi:hypothetical protein
MNIKLLNQVAEAILDEPTKFDMKWWTSPSDTSPCGTAACIAGFAVAIKREFKTMRDMRRHHHSGKVNIRTAAIKHLGIKDADEECRLFGAGYWPIEFKFPYHEARTPEERADVAFWRIQHFIATEGRE